MKQVITQPVVASRVVESDFKLRPRTIKEVGSVDTFLDQQWNTVGCDKKTDNNKIYVFFAIDMD